MNILSALIALFLLPSTSPLTGVLPAATTSHRVGAEVRGGVEEERMIDRRFSVKPGGTLNVRVADADLFVETSTTEEAHIEVFLEARDMEKAKTYFASLKFTVEQQGNNVVVETDPPKHSFLSFDRTGGARIRVRAHVPEAFNAELTTSDGDIALGRMEGRINLRTSDGDVTTAQLSGPAVTLHTSDGDVRAEAITADEIAVQTSDGDLTLGKLVAPSITVRTSDGNVRVDLIEGRAELITSDGDINLGAARGPALRLRSSDGNIHAETLYAERNELRTSDGDIDLGQVYGTVEASTSSGDVRVEMAESVDVNLHTSDGNITISAPTDLSAALSLRGDRVRVASSFAFEGRVEEESAEGDLNGGGARIEANASNGTVVLERH